MMEAASTSETPVNFYKTTQRYNPEDSHLHIFVSEQERGMIKANWLSSNCISQSEEAVSC
jgi:N6-adenosine-specific RNA methylase IME4